MITIILSKFNYNIIMLVLYRAFIGLLFFCIGNYLFRYIKDKDLGYSKIIFLLFINIIICFINGRVELWELRMNNVILYISSSITGILFIFFICKKINKNNFLEHIGKNSLIVMCTHQIIIELVNNFISIKLEINIRNTLLFSIIVCIEILIFKFVNRHKWIIGKSTNVEVSA